MNDAYIIRDDYDQTTLAVVMGANDRTQALAIAEADGITAEGEMYAVGPIHIIEYKQGDKQ
jgi:hypothetical protein